MKPVGAEHAKAEMYRNIFRSGKFYLEYSVVVDYGDAKLNKRMGDDGKTILVADGANRILYSKGGRLGDSLALAHRQSPFYGEMAKESMSDIDKLRPNVLCADGNFYLFCGKNKAIRATAEQLLDDELEAYWYQIENAVNLPKAFNAIFPEALSQSLSQRVSDFRADFAAAHPKLAARVGTGVTASFASELVESGQKEVFGQVMNFDRYVMRPTGEETQGLRPGAIYAMGPGGTPIAVSDAGDFAGIAGIHGSEKADA